MKFKRAWRHQCGSLNSARLDILRPLLGIISISFRILETRYRSGFFVILVRTGVKTRDLDILWQEINFWLFVMLENEVPNSEQFLKPFFAPYFHHKPLFISFAR